MVLRGALLASLVLLLPALIPVAMAEDTANEDNEDTDWLLTTQKELEKAGATVRVSVEQETVCTFEIQLAGPSTGADVRIATIEAAGENYAWAASSSSGSPVHAHAEGFVDTRDFVESGGWSASTMWSTGPIAEWADLSVVATNLAPWPEEVRDGWPWDDPPGEHAIAFGIECEDPVTVTLKGSQEVAILTPLYASTGAGFWTLNANALVGAHEGGVSSAQDTRFLMGSFGAQGGVVELEHPEGEESWLLSALTPGLVRVDAGAGDYQYEVTRAGAYFDAFWTYLAGFHPIETLDDIDDLPRWG